MNSFLYIFSKLFSLKNLPATLEEYRHERLAGSERNLVIYLQLYQHLRVTTPWVEAAVAAREKDSMITHLTCGCSYAVIVAH